MILFWEGGSETRNGTLVLLGFRSEICKTMTGTSARGEPVLRLRVGCSHGVSNFAEVLVCNLPSRV